jgi:hypothetical protein
MIARDRPRHHSPVQPRPPHPDARHRAHVTQPGIPAGSPSLRQPTHIGRLGPRRCRLHHLRHPVPRHRTTVLPREDQPIRPRVEPRQVGGEHIGHHPTPQGSSAQRCPLTSFVNALVGDPPLHTRCSNCSPSAPRDHDPGAEVGRADVHSSQTLARRGSGANESVCPARDECRGRRVAGISAGVRRRAVICPGAGFVLAHAVDQRRTFEVSQRPGARTDRHQPCHFHQRRPRRVSAVREPGRAFEFTSRRRRGSMGRKSVAISR